MINPEQEFINEVAKHINEFGFKRDDISIFLAANEVVKWSSWGLASYYARICQDQKLSGKFVSDVLTALGDVY